MSNIFKQQNLFLGAINLFLFYLICIKKYRNLQQGSKNRDFPQKLGTDQC